MRPTAAATEVLVRRMTISVGAETQKHQQRQAVGSEKRSQLEPLVVKSENRTEQVPRKAGKDEAAYPFQNYPKRGESQPAGIGVFEIPGQCGGNACKQAEKGTGGQQRKRIKPSESGGVYQQGVADPGKAAGKPAETKPIAAGKSLFGRCGFVHEVQKQAE